MRFFEAFERNPQATVDAAKRQPLIVAEVMAVPKLWQTLRTKQRRSAIVIDEYGTFAGLVTLEDALEEVFGEVQDEFDDEEELVLVEGATLSVRGDVRLSMLADRHNVRLPDDRADTIGGLVWHELGHLPAPGDKVFVAGTRTRLVVEAMDGQAVRRVRVVSEPEAGEE